MDIPPTNNKQVQVEHSVAHPSEASNSSVGETSKLLGPGPMRFSSANERTIQEQINALPDKERACFDAIKTKWQAAHPNGPNFSDEMYLRFARCSPGKYKFNEKTALRVMKRFDTRYLKLTAAGMEKQLLSKTLFPVPGLRTNEGHDVFYMRPSRYHPKSTSTAEIIDNLAYCINTMVEKEKCCTEGIGFLAYMNDWKMENFSVDYCYQFMMMLQGRVPVRVRMFLIVNPPHWFDVIWNIMKPMLAADFRRKVHMILESRLSEFLMEGYMNYLPDDTQSGKSPTDEMVHDFVAYRKHVEC